MDNTLNTPPATANPTMGHSADNSVMTFEEMARAIVIQGRQISTIEAEIQHVKDAVSQAAVQSGGSIFGMVAAMHDFLAKFGMPAHPTRQDIGG